MYSTVVIHVLYDMPWSSFSKMFYNNILLRPNEDSYSVPSTAFPTLLPTVPLRGRQNDDTLWRQHCGRDHVSEMLTRFATRAKFVADTNFVSWTYKMFLKISETFLVSARRATMLPRFATDGNIAGHNVAATMCPRFARALDVCTEYSQFMIT